MFADMGATIKNLWGGRIKIYEIMINNAIKDSTNEFCNKYPEAKNVKVDTELISSGAVSCTVYGVTK